MFKVKTYVDLFMKALNTSNPIHIVSRNSQEDTMLSDGFFAIRTTVKPLIMELGIKLKLPVYEDLTGIWEKGKRTSKITKSEHALSRLFSEENMSSKALESKVKITMSELLIISSDKQSELLRLGYNGGIFGLKEKYMRLYYQMVEDFNVSLYANPMAPNSPFVINAGEIQIMFMPHVITKDTIPEIITAVQASSNFLANKENGGN